MIEEIKQRKKNYNYKKTKYKKVGENNKNDTKTK